MSFRTWPLWAQIAGWIFGFWLLVPLLIWRTSWHPGAKTAATAAFLVFVGTLGAAKEPDHPHQHTLPKKVKPDLVELVLEISNEQEAQ